MNPAVLPHNDALRTFCERWKIRELAVFGSVLRDDFSATSDVDVLVSFETGAPVTAFDLVDMRDELQQLFGRGVDLVEKQALLNPFRRREILRTARVLYAA
jgi:predicted nucleotidyltransferase